jgi:Winged helix-turn helix
VDSLITAAARALAAGDPLGALKRIALREDAPALALRGTAMAQLGDFASARALLRRAASRYGRLEGTSRARCLLAEAEVALASRDLSWSSKSLSAARRILEQQGDRANATHARYLEIRYLILIGHLHEAERALHELNPDAFPPAVRAVHELLTAGIAVRRIKARAAHLALTRAARAARQAGIPALTAEVEGASRVLTAPAACLTAGGRTRDVNLREVETVLTSQTLVVDAVRFRVREAGVVIELARRPVLFSLVRMLAGAWPGDVSREALVAGAFRAKRADEIYRSRLRVEIARLRRLLRALADVTATKQGFAIVPRRTRALVVLARPVEEEHASVLALLADGESWTSSNLALALGTGPRTVQRALEALSETGKVQALGRGRARRWMTPSLPGFATALLLPASLTGA